jgi:hypothetical protein
MNHYDNLEQLQDFGGRYLIYATERARGSGRTAHMDRIGFRWALDNRGQLVRQHAAHGLG